MRDGYWINYATGTTYIIPRRSSHEISIRRPEVSFALSVPVKVYAQFKGFRIGIDRERFLKWLISAIPLMRVRGHGGLYNTFEFSAKDERKTWQAIRKMAEEFPPTKLLNVHNFATGKSVQILAGKLVKDGRMMGR